MKEATIRMPFGEISITYQTTEELREALSNLDLDINIIQEVANKVSPPTPKSAKPGYENAYRFLPNGDLELLYFPKQKVETTALVLFAFAPQPLSGSQIARFTQTPDVVNNVLSTGKNRKYFRKVGKNYRLLPDGFTLVQERVGKVLASVGTPQKDPEQPHRDDSQ